MSELDDSGKPKALDAPSAFIQWYQAVSDVYTKPSRRKAITERDIASMAVQLANTRLGFRALDQWHAALKMVSEIAGIDEERMKRIIELPVTREIRRAIRYTPRPPYKRGKNEAAYPTSGWFSDYIDMHGGMEVPAAWHFWTAVSVVAAACKRNVVLDLGNRFLWPNHYIFLVGPTGLKKSTTVDQGISLLEAVNEQVEEYAEEHPGTGDNRIHAHIGRGTPEGFLDSLAIRTDNTIPEGLMIPVEQGRVDSSGYLINDEVGTLIGKDQPGRERWISILTDMYGGKDKSAELLRTSRNREYRNLNVNVLFGSTAVWLRDNITMSAFEGGFMARFMLIYRPIESRKFPFADIVDPVQRRDMARRVAELTLMRETEITLTPEARDWFAEWYMQREPSNIGFAGWDNRKDDHMWRLATILALMDDPRSYVVTLNHVQRALRIIEVEEEFIPDCISEILETEGSRNVGRIVTTIRANGGSMSRSGLLRACRRLVENATELDVLLDFAIRTGLIETKNVSATKRGRPALIYTVVD